MLDVFLLFRREILLVGYFSIDARIAKSLPVNISDSFMTFGSLSIPMPILEIGLAISYSDSLVVLPYQLFHIY